MATRPPPRTSSSVPSDLSTTSSSSVQARLAGVIGVCLLAAGYSFPVDREQFDVWCCIQYRVACDRTGKPD